MKQSFDSSNYIIKNASNSRETNHKEVQQKKEVYFKRFLKKAAKNGKSLEIDKFYKIKKHEFWMVKQTKLALYTVDNKIYQINKHEKVPWGEGKLNMVLNSDQSNEK